MAHPEVDDGATPRHVVVTVPPDWYGVSGVVVFRGYDDSNEVQYLRVTINRPDEAIQVGLLEWATETIKNNWRAREKK